MTVAVLLPVLMVAVAASYLTLVLFNTQAAESGQIIYAAVMLALTLANLRVTKR